MSVDLFADFMIPIMIVLELCQVAVVVNYLPYCV